MFIIAIICSIVLVALDQVTKRLASAYLYELGSYPVIHGIFDLTYVENRGAAFGLMQGMRWIFVAVTPIIIGALVVIYLKLPKEKLFRWVRVAIVLIASGAVGNLIDRALNGYVVDFIHFKLIEFPVFNVADISLVIGSILFIFMMLFVIKDDKLGNQD